MQSDQRPIFVTRKVFVRRLATRLAASVAVMTALGALSHPERAGAPAPVRSVLSAAVVARTARAPETPADVVLFDRCAAACESRDPLLAGRQVADASLRPSAPPPLRSGGPAARRRRMDGGNGRAGDGARAG